MSEQSQAPDVTGSTDHPEHRSPPGQGQDAPLAQGTGGGEVQHTVFDGHGNEVVVVNTTDDEGVVAQGTGATAEEARADAKQPGDLLGEGYATDPFKGP
jgi:hypothetical protein